MRRIAPALLLAIMLLIVPRRGNAQVMADKVPGDAVVTIGWRGSENLGTEYPGSNVKGILDAVRLQDLANQYLPMVVELIKEQDPHAGNTVKLVLDALPELLKHPTVLYFRGMAPAQGDTPPLPLIGLVSQAGDQADALDAQLQAAIDSLPAKVPGLNLAKGGGLVTLQLGRSAAQNIDGITKPLPPLSASPAFISAMAQVQKDPVLWSYVDTPGLLKVIDGAIQTYAPVEFRPRWTKLRAALGLEGFGVTASSGGFAGKDWQSQSFSVINGHAGVLSLVDPRPIGDEMLDLIPKDATKAGAFHMDLAKVFSFIRDVVVQTDADTGKQFDLAMKQAQVTTGVDLEKSLIDTFGDEWVYYGTEFHGTSLLGQTIINKMRDAKTGAASLAALETVGQKLIQDFADRMPPGESLAINDLKSGDIDVMVLTLQNQQICLAINGDYFYAAPEPGMITDAINHITAKDDSILKNETFLAMRKRLNVADPLTIQFSDLPTTVPEMLTTLRGVLVMVRMMGINIPADLIPTNESLQPFLTPAMGETWLDKDGWHAKTIEPFPGASGM